MSVLILVSLALAIAVASYVAGRVMAERRISTLLRTDAIFSQSVMETLAARWGAKLEMFAEAAPPSPPKG